VVDWNSTMVPPPPGERARDLVISAMRRVSTGLSERCGTRFLSGYLRAGWTPI